MADPRKTIGVMALSSSDANVHRTVNIVTSNSNPTQIKECLQVAVASITDHQNEIVMPSASTQANLPTIYINGYTGPL